MVKLTFSGVKRGGIIILTTKERKQHETQQERAKQAEYYNYIKAPPVLPWSAKYPPYCFTVLSPVVELSKRDILVK